MEECLDLEVVVGRKNIKKLLDPAVSKEGLIKGDKILEVIRLLTKDMSFADLLIPLAIIATDIETGELVVFSEGSVVY